MTSVGYGDMYPCTVGGRLITVMCALIGAFILSLLVTVMAIFMVFDDNTKGILIQITDQKLFETRLLEGIWTLCFWD